MATVLNGRQPQRRQQINQFVDFDNKIQNFSVETVRNLLNMDNKGIAKLCAKVSLMPKKDAHGRTYFSRDDVEILRKVKALHENAQKLQDRTVAKPMENIAQVKQPASTAVQKMISTLESLEDNIASKLSKMIDEKLDGMDEVVVELVRCKTENETLRYKMNELNKENYNLKNELSKYKTIGLGLYVKKNGETLL